MAKKDVLCEQSQLTQVKHGWHRCALLTMYCVLGVVLLVYSHEYDHVNFNASMKYDEKAPNQNPLINFCRSLYEKNNLNHLKPLKDPIIPKIVHIIWVGPKTPPPIFDKCLESIQKYLPGWECKVWRDEDIPALNLRNQKYYDEESNYGAKADILRYELLHMFGGVYLDVDFVLLQPLDILHHTYEFYTGMMPLGLKAIMTNGIIGAVPGHPILEYCIESIKSHRHPVSVLRRTGPIHFEQAFYKVAKRLTDERIIAFPRSFFFPLDITNRRSNLEQVKALTKPEAFAVHYWSGSWNVK